MDLGKYNALFEGLITHNQMRDGESYFVQVDHESLEPHAGFGITGTNSYDMPTVQYGSEIGKALFKYFMEKAKLYCRIVAGRSDWDMPDVLMAMGDMLADDIPTDEVKDYLLNWKERRSRIEYIQLKNRVPYVVRSLRYEAMCLRALSEETYCEGEAAQDLEAAADAIEKGFTQGTLVVDDLTGFSRFGSYTTCRATIESSLEEDVVLVRLVTVCPSERGFVEDRNQGIAPTPLLVLAWPKGKPDDEERTQTSTEA